MIVHSKQSRINTGPEHGPMMMKQFVHESTVTCAVASQINSRESLQSSIENGTPDGKLDGNFVMVSFMILENVNWEGSTRLCGAGKGESEEVVSWFAEWSFCVASFGIRARDDCELRVRTLGVEGVISILGTSGGS